MFVVVDTEIFWYTPVGTEIFRYNVVVIDAEIFQYTPVGNVIFRYYNFSTHRCTLNYFSTAVSVHTI